MKRLRGPEATSSPRPTCGAPRLPGPVLVDPTCGAPPRREAEALHPWMRRHDRIKTP